MSNPYVIPIAAAALACLFDATAIRTRRRPRASLAAMPYLACLLLAGCVAGAVWEVARPLDSVAAALSVLSIGGLAVTCARPR